MKQELKNIKKTIIVLVAISTMFAQFKPNVFPQPPDEDPYSGIEMTDQQDTDYNRFSHRQQLSANLSFYKGMPISSYAYTNMFAYQIREDLRADVKIHGVLINAAYQDLWGPDVYLRPHMAMDAGLKYSPMNNGLFDIHARTYHRSAWSGQSIYLTFLGIPIKKLYTSKSFNQNNGLYHPGSLD